MKKNKRSIATKKFISALTPAERKAKYTPKKHLKPAEPDGGWYDKDTLVGYNFNLGVSNSVKPPAHPFTPEVADKILYAVGGRLQLHSDMETFCAAVQEFIDTGKVSPSQILVGSKFVDDFSGPFAEPGKINPLAEKSPMNESPAARAEAMRGVYSDKTEYHVPPHVGENVVLQPEQKAVRQATGMRCGPGAKSVLADIVDCVAAKKERIPINMALDELYARVRALDELYARVRALEDRIGD